ncbi:MAG: DUF433 domain-containing protein [Anaerolineae bacterium]|nr:MAG: DUF433 domain-containing protein [Anaerolineae bacterium]
MTAREIIPMNFIERPEDSELYRIAGKGITVAFLVDYIDDPEWPVERICKAYDLTPAEVYAAWAFYYAHQDEIDDYIRRAEDYLESVPNLHDHLERKHRKP